MIVIEMKQAIVIRTDVKMSRGKAAVQTAHASVAVLDKISRTKLAKWKEEGQKKVGRLRLGLEDFLCKRDFFPQN